jgi:hypothetical protein
MMHVTAESAESAGATVGPSILWAIIDIPSSFILLALGLVAAFVGQIRYQMGIAAAKVKREEDLLRMDSAREWSAIAGPRLEKELEDSELKRHSAETEVENWKRVAENFKMQSDRWHSESNQWKKRYEDSVASVNRLRSSSSRPATSTYESIGSQEGFVDERPADPGMG